MTKYEEVKDQSTEEYFKNNQFSIDAFNKKYAQFHKETYVQSLKRVCDSIASVESNKENSSYWSNRWFDEIYNDWWHPAGSIMQGAGSPSSISLANCTTVSLGNVSQDEEWDNLESIFKNSAYTVAKSAAYRQGLGIDFSKLRPKGAKVYNSSNESTGSIHWMSFIDSIGYYVGQCVSENQLILTEHGYKTIREIFDSKYCGGVFGSKGKTNIINWFSNGDKELLQIKSEYGNIIEVSKEHKVLALQDREIKELEASKLKIGDYLVCSINDIGNILEYQKIKEFSYDKVGVNKSSRLNVPKVVPEIVNEDFAYILGMLYGDGHVNHKEECIEIALANDWPKIKTLLSDKLFRVFGYNIGPEGFKVRDGDGKVERLSLGKWYYKFLKNIGCLKGKSSTLVFPEIIKRSPKSVLESFFGGVFDADGHCDGTKSGQILSLIDRDFIYNLKNELEKFGYIVKVRQKNRSNYCPTYNLSFVGRKSQLEISKCCSIKLKNSKIGKYDRHKTPYTAKDLKINYNQCKSLNSSDYVSYSNYLKYKNKECLLYIQKVENINNIGVGKTYDITVDNKDHLFSACGPLIKNSGRIPAMLFSLSVSHPDIEDFIKVKSDYTKIQNANISVQCTDKFYKAVEDDDYFELKYEIPEFKKGQKIYIDVHSIDKDCQKDNVGWFYISKKDRPAESITKKIKAKKLLRLISENMFSNAEPGIQNIDIARKYSNSDYVYDKQDEYDSRIQSTNACSEQYLSRESLCVLASLNCGKFSINENEYSKELSRISVSINRFLDNVNEYELKHNKYATPHQKLAIKKLRRTGAGYTNIAGWLFKKKLEYGTPEGNSEIENFTKLYNLYLYKSSIQLGKEKGSFGLFDKKKFLKSPFVKRVQSLGLEFDSMRNVTCSSIAPTGTLSLMFRDLVMSYGIEPAFGIYYWKRTRISGSYEYYFCVPNVVREVFKENGVEIPMESDTIKDTWDGKHGLKIVEFIEKYRDKLGIQFKPSTEISAFDKLDLMSKVMKWIDSSISVTYMLAENSKIKDVYNFILEAWKKEVKSIAAFPDRKMYGIVSYIPFRDLANKLSKEGIEIHKQNFSDDELKELNLSKEEIKLNTNSAPKRPKILDCETYVISAKGEKYIISVGLLNKEPYEIFGGKANGFGIKKNCNGKLTKHSKGKYGLEIGDVSVEDFSKHFTPEEQTLFRSVSTMLRHGIPIEFIVDQMQKSSDDMFSLPSAVARVLKKYIKNGQKVHNKECPNCKSKDLVYNEGCLLCTSCQYSKCQ